MSRTPCRLGSSRCAIAVLAVVMTLVLTSSGRAAVLWRSDFETLNKAPVTHGQVADPDNEPDPDPATPPEPDAVDNSLGTPAPDDDGFGEADQLDSASAPYPIAPAYLYKKYGMPGVGNISPTLDPFGAAGLTAFYFADNHRAAINTELPSGNVAGLPYNLNQATTVEGYFNTAYADVINYQTTVPVRLYGDMRSNQDGAIRFSVGLSNYQPPATEGLFDYEGFDYAGSTLVGGGGGTGWKAGSQWVHTTSGETAAAVPATLADPGPGLNYDGILFTAPLVKPTAVGTKVSFGSSSGPGVAERLMKSSVDMGTEGKVMWVSFLTRKAWTGTTPGGGSAIFLRFFDNIYNLRLLIAINSGNPPRFSLAVAGGAQSNTGTGTSTAQVINGTTYFVVVKLVCHAASSDEAAMWVFEPTGTQGGLDGNVIPATEAGLLALPPVHRGATNARADGWVANANSNAILDRLHIRCDQNNQQGEIDEIRIGSTYESVVDASAPISTVPNPINVLGLAYVNSAGSTLVQYGTTPILANTWYHFAAVYDGTDPAPANRTVKAYLNGALEVSANANLANTGTAPIVIGNDRFQSEIDSRNWNGMIDEIRVYDKVLTPAEMMINAPAHTDRLVWASSFETEKGQPVAHDQQPVTGLEIEPGDGRRGFISSIDTAVAGYLGTGGYAVTPDLMRYVKYGQAGVTAPPPEVDPLGLAGETAMYFPVERSASIETNIPSNSGNLANKVTFECIFNSWDPTLQTGTATLTRRLFSQRMSAGDSRLAFGLGRSATGNPLTVFYTSANAHRAHGEATATVLHVFTDTQDVAPHQWHRAKLVWDGATVRAYLDGVKRIEFVPYNDYNEVTQLGVVGMAAPSAHTLVVGNHVTSVNGTQAYGFYGLIDQAEIRDDAIVCNFPFADADGDGDVDQADFAAAQLCFSGDGQPLAAGCECFDRPTTDGDVDAFDLGEFAKCATAPNVSWSIAITPGCVP
ncbi:MAG: LamG domain-containing protein [Phycisphaerae bacterium]